MAGRLQRLHLLDEIAKIRNHFRRAAGKIDCWDIRLSEPTNYPIDGLARHDFLAFRPGVHVTMHARQVAKLAHVYLENFGAPTPKRDGIIRQFLRKAIRPLLPENTFLSMRFDHLPP